MLLAAVSFTACDKGGEAPKVIELIGGTLNSQIVYADETSKAEGIKFIAQAPWTASVNATKAGVDWLTLSETSGGAGSFTLGLTLQENKTGANRKAEIRIECGGLVIIIIVEQTSTPKPNEPDEPSTGNVFITANGQLTGGEIFGIQPTDIEPIFTPFLEDGTPHYPGTRYPYKNKTFDITLPAPATTAQGAFIPGLNVLPSDAKFSALVLDTYRTVGSSTIGLTELELVNFNGSVNDENHLLKKGEGRIIFFYASKAATINGTSVNNMGFRVDSFIFENCTFRQGWNEMMMITIKDETVDRRATFTVTINNSSSSFRWRCNDSELEPKNPEQCVMSKQ